MNTFLWLSAILLLVLAYPVSRLISDHVDDCFVDNRSEPNFGWFYSPNTRQYWTIEFAAWIGALAHIFFVIWSYQWLSEKFPQVISLNPHGFLLWLISVVVGIILYLFWLFVSGILAQGLCEFLEEIILSPLISACTRLLKWTSTPGPGIKWRWRKR